MTTGKPDSRNNVISRLWAGAVAAALVAVLAATGCGVSKPLGGAGSGGASGSSGGASGSSGGATGGGSSGSGGFSIDANLFDLKLDGINLSDLNLDGLNFDLGGLDLALKMCASGVKNGSTCIQGTDTACSTGPQACACFIGQWVCANI